MDPEKMKISMIGLVDIEGVQGGIEQHVNMLARGLDCHEVTIYCRGKRIPSPSEHVRKVYVPTIRSKHLETPVYAFCATLHALTQGQDIIHYHALAPAGNSWLPRMFRIPVVTTVHGLDYMRRKWGRIGRTYIRLCEQIALKCSDRVIVASRHLVDYYLEKNRRRTEYVPNCIEVKSLREPRMITEKYGLEGEGYILYVGRLVPEKGLDCLIAAYKMTDTGKKLVIAGASSHTGDYIKGLLTHESDDIIFTGFVKGRELEELYSNACLFVLPSEIEGQSISLLEALSYGRNALVSDIPENKMVAPDHVKTFKAGDASDLAEKLRTMVDEDPAYSEDAVSYIKLHHDVASMVERTEKIYLELMGRPPIA
ncbi:glycosyltransferase family 4 protein [Candidatus Altiarchaeota archaeon]